MKLIIEPDDGIACLLDAIRTAKKSVEIAVFRFDRRDIEEALKTVAAEKNMRVVALIAYSNRGGEKKLRKLETRFLEVGITVARSAPDLGRYHDKYILIDRRALYVLSFNFTHLDIDHSRGFGIVSESPQWVKEAGKLFEADCARNPYTPGPDTFVVSPLNARKALGAFLRQAKKQLLIYDPMVSDKEMLRILQERAKAGVEVRVIGEVAGPAKFDVQKLAGRLHTRTIIRDRRHAFVGSQSLRAAELDSRRELGLIISDGECVRRLLNTFESDWVATCAGTEMAPAMTEDREEAAPEDAEKPTDRVVEILERELNPLATEVREAVRKAVAQAGEEVVNDKEVKDTVKKVVKKAVKEAVQKVIEGSREGDEPRRRAS